MRASTEEFLYELWFIAETTLRPTWRDLLFGSDFESWAWRKGLHRRLGELARLKMIDAGARRRPTTERILRLTQAGRNVAFGGRDPEREWARAWDGRWRMLLFDLPMDREDLRRRLHRTLRRLRFGFLQGSVWLSPHGVEKLGQGVVGIPVDPESFLLFEGRPASGEADAQLVAGAWDFAEINQRYERYLQVLAAAPKLKSGAITCRAPARTWLQSERAAWRHAVALDPLLPSALLPKNYRGREAWSAQRRIVPRVIRRLF